MQWRFAMSIALASCLCGLPSVQGFQAGDGKVHEVEIGGLKIEGKVADCDPKFKIVPQEKKNEVTLPGKMFQVKLKAGKRYRISLDSSDIDSVLLVTDSADKQLAFDDDGGGGLNALLFLDPAKDGTYKIHALSIKGTGAFLLQVKEAVVHQLVGGNLTLKGNLGKAKKPVFAYNVKFEAGKTYVIDMISPDQKALDPYLTLLDPAGKTLAEDDDGGDGLNARITFRAPAAGIYRIVCTSFERSGAGPYVLMVREKK
jgi:hypothetical protein